VGRKKASGKKEGGGNTRIKKKKTMSQKERGETEEGRERVQEIGSGNNPTAEGRRDINKGGRRATSRSNPKVN